MNPHTTDTESSPATPRTKARLEALITGWRKDSGQPVARLNLRIAAMMLAGALARVLDRNGQAMFATKGGIAMELRMGERARTTRDIDLVLRGDADTLTVALQQGLAEPYHNFTFRHGAITALPPRPQVKQVKVQVSFAGKIVCSPKLEIAPTETGHEEFIAIPGMDLRPVGLQGPDLVLVLAEHWQIAQKLHALTEKPADGKENLRYWDLIDLQMLEALAGENLAPVKDACKRTFAARHQQPWPPRITIYPNWSERYTAMAKSLDMPITDVNQAVKIIHAFIHRIDQCS
jgi:hypothetical protein